MVANCIDAQVTIGQGGETRGNYRAQMFLWTIMASPIIIGRVFACRLLLFNRCWLCALPFVLGLSHLSHARLVPAWASHVISNLPPAAVRGSAPPPPASQLVSVSCTVCQLPVLLGCSRAGADIRTLDNWSLDLLKSPEVLKVQQASVRSPTGPPTFCIFFVALFAARR